MIENAIHHHLQTSGLSSQDFSELLIRLLDYGVITRDESTIETQLYDRFMQCESLVEEYLSVIGVRLLHDRRFQFVRIFPPGAQVPGIADDEHQPFNGGFRNRPSQQEVALILVMRVEYEKSLREGAIDEKGGAAISLESLAIASKNLLKRPLPENQLERKSAFKRLRQLRLIHFASDCDLESPESWIRIQPAITRVVTDDVLEVLYPAEDAQREDAH